MENAGMDFYSRDLISSRLLDSGRDTRFALSAYEFVFLVFSVLEKVDSKILDFSARELTQTTVKTANVLYGPIAEFVLADMGIKTFGDIGDIISNIVDLKLLPPNAIEERYEFYLLSKKPLFSKVIPKPLDMEKLKNYEDT